MSRKLQGDDRPLYRQMIESLRTRILGNEWKNGEKIPTEPELSEEYSVSRITVRNAIAELEAEGLLIRRQGRGTFVCKPKIQRKIEHLASFSSACEANGLKAGARILARKPVSPDAELRRRLGLGAGGKALYIQRLRTANVEPIMIENNYFPLPRFAFLSEEALDGSLYELLMRKYGICPADSKSKGREAPRTSIEVARADAECANILGVPLGAPLFNIKTLIMGEDGLPIHFGDQFIRGDRYVITMP